MNRLPQSGNSSIPVSRLNWSATFDGANRITGEQLNGGSARIFSYQYAATGPTVGLLQTSLDLGRGVTNVLVYDAWLRVATNRTYGGAASQCVTNQYGYDPRGLKTNIIQTVGGRVGGRLEFVRA